METTGISPLRRVMAALMAVVLAMGLTPTGAWAAAGGDAALTAGSLGSEMRALDVAGDSGDVLVIATSEQFASFRDTVNAGDNFAGRTVQLDADIDLSGMSWEPVGGTAKAKRFAGTFDGKGHTVTMGGIDDTKANATGGAALFGCLAGDAVVQNLTVAGTVVSGVSSVAGVAATSYGASFVNVRNLANVKATASSPVAGGVLATVGAGPSGDPTVFENCANKGNVEAGSGNYAAGIANVKATSASAYAVLSNCYNTGEISATTNMSAKYLSGILSINASCKAASTLRNCYNSGVLTGTNGSGYGLSNASTWVSLEGSSYYLDSAPAGGIGASVDAADAKTAEEMASSAFVEALNGASEGSWVAGSSIKPAQDTPALAWEVDGTAVEPDPEPVVDPADQAKVEAVAAKFTGYAFPIRYAKGYTNVAQAVLDTIKGYDEFTDGMTVTLKSRDEGSKSIAADGAINYRTGDFGYVNVENVSNCVFTIGYKGATADTAPRTVQVGWDLDYFKGKMQEEADTLTGDSIKGDNASLDGVTKDLALTGSGAANVGSSWSRVSWTSSNTDVIDVQEIDYSTNFKGVVNRPVNEDAEVILTATFIANDTKLTSNCESVDEVGSITKEFKVKVKGIQQVTLTEEQLGYLLDTYYLPAVESNGVALSNGDAVSADVDLPRYTRIEFKGDDAEKYRNNASETLVFNNKEIKVASSNSAIVINGYRGAIDRFTGEESTELTVSLTRDNVTATRTLTLKVAPVEGKVLDEELAKLEKVKSAYWAGLNDGVYADANSVTGSLRSFQEALVDGEGNVTFVYNKNDAKGNGFKADNYFEDSWEMEGAGYNRFKSSNPAVLQHENLVLADGAQPEDSVEVTISSLISSETYGPMAAKHPENEALQKLYKQEVSQTVTVLGTKVIAARAAVSGLAAVDELTDADKDAVVAARSAFNELSALDKKLFGEELSGKLTASEEKLGLVAAPKFAEAEFSFSVRVGEVLNETVAVSGAPTPVVAVAEGSSLPEWLSLSGEGALSGTAPSEAGAFTFAVEATNEIAGEVKKATAKVTVTVAPAPVAAKPVDVYMTVSNKGTLELARQKVTATDVNADGTITFDEALQAAHGKFCPGGYATAPSSYGGLMVTKLWGIATTSTIFYKNDAATGTVDSEVVAAGDELVASVLKDEVNWSDHYGFFDKKQVTVNAGEAFALTLKAVNGMAYPPVTVDASDVQVGTWANGAFKAISGAKTDASGKVTLKFDVAGTYVVSASGTVPSESWSGEKVDAPITAPVCVVTVKAVSGPMQVVKAENTMKVSAKKATVKRAVVKKKSVSVKPLKVTKAKGKKSFKVTKWTTKKAKKWLKVNVKTGKVTVKKGAPKGTYKFKVEVTAAGDKDYKELVVTKTVTIKVK